jgi:phenylpyruvate tautomerase PptA (4-oxalocrotonate tautomerase family)
MPLIRLYIAPSVLSTTEKEELAQKLTAIYVSRVKLPAFYVNVLFVELPENSYYIGGQARNNFIRIAIEHIALRFPNPEREQSYMKALDDVIVPLFTSKGLDWEYHISETSRELWKIQSLVPPPHLSEAHENWFKENKPTPWGNM